MAWLVSTRWGRHHGLQPDRTRWEHSSWTGIVISRRNNCVRYVSITAVPHKVVCSFVLWIELWSDWLFCVEYHCYSTRNNRSDHNSIHKTKKQTALCGTTLITPSKDVTDWCLCHNQTIILISNGSQSMAWARWDIFNWCLNFVTILQQSTCDYVYDVVLY